MRIDTIEFDSLNELNTRVPIFVVEVSFDTANSDIHYLTSREVIGLTGNIINDTLKNISSTSQKINPEKAVSTIGSISFECIDAGLTDLQRAKLQSGDGLKGKRVRVFKGFEGLDWSEYSLIQTQIVSSEISYKDGVYKFQCSDVQRVLRKQIFDVKETALAGNLTRTSTTVNVFDTSQFELVKQPPSPSGLTDAPSQTVGYLKIKNDDQIEIIRYTGKTATSFTGCTRGVLGTRPLEVEADGTDSDKSTKVEEYVYLEMPAPMLAYAVYTGVIYGQVEGLPDHWHLGVPAEFIRTSDFENIGVDWFDTNDFDKGVPAVIRGVTKTDGKRFIEQELLVMLGAFSPVYTNGEIGIQRLNPIIGDGAYGLVLNEDNIISYGDLKHDLDSVINKIIIAWNYVESRDGFTRRSILIDPDSIQKHGESKPLELNLRALESSRHSYSTIKNRFDALRERYAGPPLRLRLTLAPTLNALEVGDVVRVELDQIQDFTQDGSSIGRNFEVQRVQQDWIKGTVNVDLFGSSDVASAVPESEPDTVIENSFYNSLGTEINSTNFGASVSSSGGVTTISSDIYLNGTGNANDTGSIYFCNESLTLNAGATIYLNGSPQLRVNGFFQVNGTIDGHGRGFPGGQGNIAPRTWVGSGFDKAVSKPYRTAANNGTSGFPNPLQELQRGVRYIVTNTWRGNNPQLIARIEENGRFRQGSNFWGNSAPTLDLKFNGTDKIEGLISELRASSGAGGEASEAFDHESTGTPTQMRGSDGGASGCGVIIICKGADIGANGLIDTSGEDAENVTITPLNTLSWASFGMGLTASVANCSGAGGAAGVVYWLIDGVTANPPNLNAQNSRAFVGKAKDYIYPGTWDFITKTPPVYSYGFPRVKLSNGIDTRRILASNPNQTISSYYHSNRLQRLNSYQSLHKIQFITGIVEPDNDIEVFADDATFALSEVVNTPETSAGDRSTIEVAITPPPSDENYSYSLVEYRKQGVDTWTQASPSRFESTVEVKSDGSVYEFRLRSVPKSGQTSPTGDIQTITTTDVVGKTDAELAVIYPFSVITGLSLDTQGSFFIGLGPNFEWSNENAELAYFNHYEVKIESGGQLLRTEQSVSPFYTYTFDKNIADYERIEGSEGRYFDIDIDVSAVSKIRNDQNELYKSSSVSFSSVASNTNNANNLRFFVIPSKTSELSDDAGLGNSADWGQVSNVPSQIFEGTSFFNLNDWTAGTVGVTSEFSSLYMAADNEIVSAVSPYGFTEPVYQLTKGASSNLSLTSYQFNINPEKAYRFTMWFKVVSGSGEIRPRAYGDLKLNSDITQHNFAVRSSSNFTTGEWHLFVGYIKSSSTPFSSDSDRGFYNKNGGFVTAVNDCSFQDDATTLFTDFWCRSMSVDFQIQVSRPRLETMSGSDPKFVNLITGTKSAEDLLNSEQDWTEVQNVPDYLSDSATTGLNVTASYFGYFDGTNWRSYIDNLGRMYLNGPSGNALEWDGSALEIKGDSAISLGNSVFGQQGIQIEHNGGNPRAHFGDGGDRFLKYENGELVTGNSVAWRGLDSYNSEGSDFVKVNWVSPPASFSVGDGNQTSENFIEITCVDDSGANGYGYFQTGLSSSQFIKAGFHKNIRMKTHIQFNSLESGCVAYFGINQLFRNIASVNASNLDYDYPSFGSLGWVVLNSNSLYGVACKSFGGQTSHVTLLSMGTITANQQQEVEFILDPVAGSVEFLKNGVSQGVISDANVPTSTTLGDLRGQLFVKNTNGQVSSMSVGEVRVLISDD